MEVEETVRDSRLPHSHKEAVMDMLTAAGNATNGAADKIQALAEAVEGIAIFLSRQARHEQSRTDHAVSAHATACPLRSGPGGYLGRVYAFRWPIAVVLCVALFSPYAGPALARVIERNVNIEAVSP